MAISMVDSAVFARQDAFRVLQDPVGLRRAADAEGSAVEDFGDFLTRRESLIAGDGEFQGHDAISGARTPLRRPGKNSSN